MSSMAKTAMKKMGMRMMMAVLCAALLSTVPMMAQDNGGAPPPPPPGGGPGHRGPGGPGRMGPPPLGMLTKQLDLTPDQVTQIKGYYADERTQMEALRGDTSLSQQDRRQKMFSIRKDTQTKFMAALTEDQKSKLKTMRENMKEHRGHGGPGGQGGHGGPPPPPPAQ